MIALKAGTPASFAHTTVPPRTCRRSLFAADPLKRSVPSPHLEMLSECVTAPVSSMTPFVPNTSMPPLFAMTGFGIVTCSSGTFASRPPEVLTVAAPSDPPDGTRTLPA